MWSAVVDAMRDSCKFWTRQLQCFTAVRAAAMGSFAKALGQMARKSLETESANIIKVGCVFLRGMQTLAQSLGGDVQTVKANKIPGSLSLSLDGTLSRGHDMKTFGLGTVAALANRER